MGLGDNQPYTTKAQLAEQVIALRKQLRDAAVREHRLMAAGTKAMEDATEYARRQSRVIRVQRWGAIVALAVGVLIGWCIP